MEWGCQIVCFLDTNFSKKKYDLTPYPRVSPMCMHACIYTHCICMHTSAPCVCMHAYTHTVYVCIHIHTHTQNCEQEWKLWKLWGLEARHFYVGKARKGKKLTISIGVQLFASQSPQIPHSVHASPTCPFIYCYYFYYFSIFLLFLLLSYY